MMATFFTTVLTALLAWRYLDWGRGQAEKQIDRMQEAAFDTPGVEPLVTPPVILAGVGLILANLTAGWLLGMKAWQRALSLAAGIAGGAGVFLIRSGGDR